MPLAIYMGMRASGLEAVPRRHYGSEGLLGSSLAGQLQRQTRKRRDAPHLLTVVSKGLPLTASFLGLRSVLSKRHLFLELPNGANCVSPQEAAGAIRQASSLQARGSASTPLRI